MLELVQPTAVACLSAGPVEYRLDRRGDVVVLIFHGGHVRAGLALGEDAFAAAGCTVLVPSRPGYGRTPLSTGTSVERYTDVVRELCAQLGVARIAAVVGISGGGPTAATMAAKHADLVERVILISAVGWLPYPERWMRAGARLAFTAMTERLTWAGVRMFARVAPDACLRAMLGSLSTRPVGEVATPLSADDRALLLALFTRMRSGSGFVNDLHPTPDVTAQIDQPALVIASRADGGVPFAHAVSLVRSIRRAELVESRAHSHFVWLGTDWPAITERIHAFLDTDPDADTNLDAPAVGIGSSGLIPDPVSSRPRSNLVRAFHRPLRAATAALALAGALLAAGTAGPAFAGTGTAGGLTFVAVAVASVCWAVAVLRGPRWVLVTTAVLLGGQLAAVVGVMWELAFGIAASKADSLRALGVPPIAGLLVNLAYSAVAVALFCWLAQRWWKARRPSGEAPPVFTERRPA